MKKLYFFIFLLSFTIAATAQNLDSLVDNAIKISLKHLKTSVFEVVDTTQFPSYSTKDYKWEYRGAEKWTSSFYPGCLWYAFELSGDEQFESLAAMWTERLKNETLNERTHDMGFKFMCTFGNGLRFGTQKDYSFYKKYMLEAADTFSKRYSKEAGSIRSSWDAKYFESTIPVITDIMMNLELLLWGAENGGDKEWATLAKNHATNTNKNFSREDGSTYHIVRYDSISGDIVNKGTIQGEGDETTWSRGHAWTVYGMVMMYRYTKEERYKDYAIKFLNYFLDNLEEDQIPLWDFDTKRKYKDVSAACIVTSAMFELVNYIDDEALKTNYNNKAEKILTSLCKKPYLIENTNVSPILDHSVHFYTRNFYIDRSSIIADYYFLEALSRYKENKIKS